MVQFAVQIQKTFDFVFCFSLSRICHAWKCIYVPWKPFPKISKTMKHSPKKRERRRALGLPKLRLKRFAHGSDTLEFKVSLDMENLGPVARVCLENASCDVYFISISFILATCVSFYTASPFLLVGLVLVSFRAHYGTVKSESLLAIQEMGVQLTTTYLNGTKHSKFIEKAKIRSVLMNEGVTLCRVVLYVAFIVKNESKMILAFENLRPNLRALSKVIGGICSVMFGESGENSVSSVLKKPLSPTSTSRSRRRKTSKRKVDNGIRRRVFKDEDE